MKNIETSTQQSTEDSPGQNFPQDSDQTNDSFFSNEARRVLELLFCVVINAPIGVIGLAANIINIIIFVKQGFSDAINVSLCGLAVSDLGSLVPLVWIGICYNPLFRNADIGFDSSDISYLTGGLQHSCFSRITGWITAFITFERCVCIALPLKVKAIITPRRVFFAIVAVSLIVYAFSIPIFVSIYFAARFHEDINKTLIGLAYTADAENLRNISFSFGVFSQLSSFIIVIICTVILILKLISKSQWRQQAISLSGTSDSISSREKKVMKMVTFISVIFIICYLPVVISLLCIVHFSKDFGSTGRYVNSFYIMWAIFNMLEVINSSTTVLVYYNMSTKYRASFNWLFGIVNTAALRKLGRDEQ